ncbi:MAG: hypothetical protein KGD58_00640 [Candidatus Lokiarchaeota archaeon]|nr:hypothetical protein [Candidatus Lokiarchaeota archaeon]
MSLIPPEEKEEIITKLFIDWDKCKNMFYNNIYLENSKIVIKMPLIPRDGSEDELKIRRFDLGKYTYLCSY